jgi:hypothetical protein
MRVDLLNYHLVPERRRRPWLAFLLGALVGVGLSLLVR